MHNENFDLPLELLVFLETVLALWYVVEWSSDNESSTQNRIRSINNTIIKLCNTNIPNLIIETHIQTLEGDAW